jgi:hypothetical protein
MKAIINTMLLVSMITNSNKTFSQNVGIGTLTPTLGKLEIKGVAGTGTTVAAFGTDGAGLSIQKDALGPIVGFNHYRDLTIANSQGKHFANGFAGIFAMETANGKLKFDMFDFGVKDGFTSAGRRVLTIANNGNMGLLGESLTGASLYVPRRTNINGSAYFDGTSYPSAFQYGATEDTYIRGGKNGAKVYINDIPNGDVEIGQVGVGTTNVGINITPRATLDVNGDVVLKRTVIISSSTSTISSLNRQGASILHFTTPGASFMITNLTGIAGGVDGMIIHIMVDYPDNPLNNNFIIKHESPAEPIAQNRIICGSQVDIGINGSGGCTLIYDGISSRWRMIGFVQ